MRSGAPYVRTDGVQIAANWADLTDGAIAALEASLAAREERMGLALGEQDVELGADVGGVLLEHG